SRAEGTVRPGGTGERCARSAAGAWLVPGTGRDDGRRPARQVRRPTRPGARSAAIARRRHGAGEPGPARQGCGPSALHGGPYGPRNRPHLSEIPLMVEPYRTTRRVEFVDTD